MLDVRHFFVVGLTVLGVVLLVPIVGLWWMFRDWPEQGPFD
jgi:hypothetical protein